ncbi:hypothetical protein Csa_021740 [Cucumis sativus]|uniref:Uncharacterized protein n=1 Tax=Cucumis sativus TaxID=3659 RepID=A0A0A0KG95_CUCSA|nr:hypothetical protein Csa_021740 [Cucumis sativus]
MGFLREREIRGSRGDLAKIGREGFQIIDEYFGRASSTGARRVAAKTARPALPQPPRKAEQPPRIRKEKPVAAVTSDQVAKHGGGTVITTWRPYAK